MECSSALTLCICPSQANNDALADALKELEATTAALNCFEDTYSRQSVVSSSGYGTTTSNSSASEEVPVVTQGENLPRSPTHPSA